MVQVPGTPQSSGINTTIQAKESIVASSPLKDPVNIPIIFLRLSIF
jgi:hypothetical protein